MQNNGKRTRDDKHQKLVDYLKTLQDTEFTGYIKVNYTQGSVGRIEKFEEILKK
jgi:hypothetical protein